MVKGKKSLEKCRSHSRGYEVGRSDFGGDEIKTARGRQIGTFGLWGKRYVFERTQSCLSLYTGCCAILMYTDSMQSYRLNKFATR